MGCQFLDPERRLSRFQSHHRARGADRSKPSAVEEAGDVATAADGDQKGRFDVFDADLPVPRRGKEGVAPFSPLEIVTGYSQ
jgi:hypothetical protein